MDVIDDYLQQCRKITDTVSAQKEILVQAAQLFTDTILSGRMVHVFGSGHSRIMVEEM